MKVNEVKLHLSKKKLRVAAYCRVSTEHDEQEDSLENQITAYKEEIKSDPRYEFVDVYYDFDISGFKENREGFKRMVEDALDGKIDLIITKSISRLARNTKLFLKTIRTLKAKNVGVYFELQGINTLTAQGELMLTIYAAFAEEESQNTRELIRLHYRRRYEAGEPVQYLYRCFGYTRDAEKNVMINADEAKWIRDAYRMVADGYTIAQVKKYLNENGATSPAGAPWGDTALTRLIESEIYKGDYIMHKYYVNDERKLVRNNGEEDSWYIENDHDAIISKALWQKAQDALAKRREYLSMDLEHGEKSYRAYLYCAYCGHPLYPRKYSNGNRLCCTCGGMSRYGKGFCRGVNVPDTFFKEQEISGEQRASGGETQVVLCIYLVG